MFKIKDDDTLQNLVLLTAIANSVAFLDSDLPPDDEFAEIIGDFVEQVANKKVPLLAKDKGTQKASKSLATESMSEFHGAMKVSEYRRARRAQSEGMNNITRANYGDEVYELVKNELAILCKLVKKPPDFTSEAVKLLLNSVMYQMRKELSARRLYNGPVY